MRQGPTWGDCLVASPSLEPVPKPQMAFPLHSSFLDLGPACALSRLGRASCFCPNALGLHHCLVQPRGEGWLSKLLHPGLASTKGEMIVDGGRPRSWMGTPQVQTWLELDSVLGLQYLAQASPAMATACPGSGSMGNLQCSWPIPHTPAPTSPEARRT